MGRRREVYKKACAQYVCSRETCRKMWTSIHSWKQTQEFCECGKEAVQVDLKDHKLDLDNFNCDVCGDFWQSIHDAYERDQICFCGEYVTAEGRQKRFGRHYWWECVKGCGVKWEDFSMDRDFSQRCTACGSRGNILGLFKPKNKKKSQKGRAGDGARDDETKDKIGSHMASHCDMCQHLIQSGRRSGCASVKKVECRVNTRYGSSKLQVIALE